MDGYKTYIVALCGLAYAGFGIISGHMDWSQAGTVIEQALLAVGLRSAISNK